MRLESGELKWSRVVNPRDSADQSIQKCQAAFPIAAYTSGLIAIFPPFVVAS